MAAKKRCPLLLLAALAALETTIRVEVATAFKPESTVVVGDRVMCARRAASGGIDCWGKPQVESYDPYDPWDATTGGLLLPPELSSDVKTVSLGGNFGAVVKQSGRVVVFQAGNTTISSHLFPSFPSSLNFTDVCLGDSHLCGLQTNGTVRCASTSGSSALAAAPAQAVFSQISCGHDFTCGVLACEGTLTCWGSPSVIGEVIPGVDFNFSSGKIPMTTPQNDPGGMGPIESLSSGFGVSPSSSPHLLRPIFHNS